MQLFFRNGTQVTRNTRYSTTKTQRFQERVAAQLAHNTTSNNNATLRSKTANSSPPLILAALCRQTYPSPRSHSENKSAVFQLSEW